MIRFTKQLPHPLPNEVSVTDVLAALSDPIRLAIIATLARYGERKMERVRSAGLQIHPQPII